ncbi:uncharacterized protein [Antedon mediterranea]|uniref:uncharacterized protein isoform X1 n=1 Tax=Antedon mediterranea TaxID=105859 RepID=UPI003AF7EED4
MSKIFERIVHDGLSSHVANALSPRQHGFVSGRSCQTNLALLLATSYDAINSKKQCDVIYTDFSKAFDSVSHDLLIFKLSKFGLSGSLLSWFKSYLTNRQQRVVIGGETSDWLPVLSGVPQGSILGPLLFNLFINDLPLKFNHSESLLFADDLKLFKVITTPQDAFSLQEDLNGLVEWTEKWGIKLNANKCKYLSITLKKRPVLFNYNLSGHDLEMVYVWKDLGIRSLADAHTCVDLVEASDRFLEKHFEEVAKGDEFLQLPVDQLVDILTSEDLNVSSEEEVYNAIIRWVYVDKKNRMSCLPRLLKEIRFTFLSPHFLVDILEMEELIRYDWKCRDILDEAKNFHMFPDRRKHHRLANMKPRTSTVGCIFSVGGMDSTGHSLNSVECYNLRSHRVSIEASMMSSRSGVAITNLDNRLLAIGGYDGRYLSSVEAFNPGQRNWCPMTSMNQVRRYHSACTLDRQVYVVGGYNGRSVLDTVECYDPRTNRWRRLSSMGHRRRHLGLVSTEDYICAIGGSDGSAYLDVVEVYEPRIDKWRVVCSLQSRRGGVAAGVLGGKIYALGGYNGQANLATVERYYPVEDRWVYVAPMNQCRSGHGVVPMGESLYVVGGHDGTQYLSTAEKFDQTVGEWHSIGSIGMPRAVAGVSICKNMQFT